MRRLAVIHLDHNNIKFLPVAFASLTRVGDKGGQLKVRGNPIVFPPASVCDQGAQKILAFLRQGEQDNKSKTGPMNVVGTKLKIKSIWFGA